MKASTRKASSAKASSAKASSAKAGSAKTSAAKTGSAKAPSPKDGPNATRRKQPRTNTPLPALSSATSAPAVLQALRELSTPHDRSSLPRYGIVAKDVLGVSMANIQKLGKQLGPNHALALALWKTGCYEARLLTAFIAEPQRLSAAQMDQWCAQFDNWAVCDTLCFHLFDRSPHAWDKVAAWCPRPEEFVRRAGFALLACLAGHDKLSSDERFLKAMKPIELAAADERNFVKKALSWALRRIATRNGPLHRAALDVAKRLAERPEPSARWIGKDALRQLTRPASLRKSPAPSKPLSPRKPQRT